MSRILRNIIKESRKYDTRVQKTADELMKMFPSGITRKQFELNIDKAAKITDSFEVSRGSASAKKDFIKDVASKIKFARDNNKAKANKAARDKMLSDIMHMIHDAVSNSIPDGDPYDYLIPKITRKYRIRDYEVVDYLDAAVKRHEKMKSFNEYLKVIWDDYGSGNLGTDPIKNYRNPWG